MYKPNFCAECGERVEGAGRRRWASRRFCRPCARRFRSARLLRPLALAALLLGGGFLAGRAGRPSPPPPFAEAGTQRLAPLAPAAARRPAEGRPGGAATKEEGRAVRQFGPDGSADERPTDPDEVVSICGARTQKGTPCRRRVRGVGRCWQHRGKAAVLPPSKLVVPG
ncbi:MAG TPA: hypothetical protein VEY09_12455 [Pyrinomonadaceae bacterium]|nr:hypothetical protein [Pyrinomonadaceae bacterium]